MLLLSACSSSTEKEGCEPDDADGIIGGDRNFVLVVDDAAFDPLILKTQNSANVTLTLENHGTVPHGFQIDCLATPNQDGCPLESCFESESTIAPVAPGETGTASFVTPRVEGIYTFRAGSDAEAPTGQFVVQ
ncbi:MAG: hypothetical protein QM756_45955 [Polyangiaceae bacterium]